MYFCLTHIAKLHSFDQFYFSSECRALLYKYPALIRLSTFSCNSCTNRTGLRWVVNVIVHEPDTYKIFQFSHCRSVELTWTVYLHNLSVEWDLAAMVTWQWWRQDCSTVSPPRRVMLSVDCYERERLQGGKWWVDSLVKQEHSNWPSDLKSGLYSDHGQ
jgi:hypothetical protein